MLKISSAEVMLILAARDLATGVVPDETGSLCRKWVGPPDLASKPNFNWPSSTPILPQKPSSIPKREFRQRPSPGKILSSPSTTYAKSTTTFARRARTY
jgi:hypothetical protein